MLHKKRINFKRPRLRSSHQPGGGGNSHPSTNHGPPPFARDLRGALQPARGEQPIPTAWAGCHPSRQWRIPTRTRRILPARAGLFVPTDGEQTAAWSSTDLGARTCPKSSARPRDGSDGITVPAARREDGGRWEVGCVD